MGTSESFRATSFDRKGALGQIGTAAGVSAAELVEPAAAGLERIPVRVSVEPADNAVRREDRYGPKPAVLAG